jgi:hypothetical protein
LEQHAYFVRVAIEVVPCVGREHGDDDDGARAKKKSSGKALGEHITSLLTPASKEVMLAD